MSYPRYQPESAFAAPVDARMTFVRKTYAHLAGAIALFVVLSVAFYQAGVGLAILQFMGTSRFGWLLILGGFMGAGYLAQAAARSRQSIAIQYAGLGLYALAEAVIFSPLLLLAAVQAPNVLPDATILTLTMFIGLTVFTLFSKKDFSFLGSILAVVGLAVMGLIICAVCFGFSLGIWFSAAMIVFAGCAVVYSTSNVLRVYPTDQYVAAALDLFAAVALLFWYVLRIVMSLQRR